MEKDFEKLRITIRDFANKYYFETKRKYENNKSSFGNQSFLRFEREAEEAGEDLKWFFLARTIFKDYTFNEIKELMK